VFVAGAGLGVCMAFLGQGAADVAAAVGTARLARDTVLKLSNALQMRSADGVAASALFK
jgi:hypothetical protein